MCPSLCSIFLVQVVITESVRFYARVRVLSFVLGFVESYMFRFRVQGLVSSYCSLGFVFVFFAAFSLSCNPVFASLICCDFVSFAGFPFEAFG